MRISVIMPIYDPEGKNEQLTSQALLSIIRTSLGKEIEIIPVYHKTLNYSTAVNIGLQRSTGDYIIVANNDIEVFDNEWLDKYTQNSGITSWRLFPFHLEPILVPDGSLWGITREAYNTIGLLDEQFKDGYGYEDTDYWYRAREAGIPIRAVKANVVHKENKTFQQYFNEKKSAMTEHNEYLFRTKWNV